MKQATFDIRNLRLERVFVHDDRIGPYVPATLVLDSSRVDLDFELPDGKVIRHRVTSAAVPLYPKIRTTAGELLDVSFSLAPWLEAVVKDDPETLELDCRFARSGTYLEQLYNRPELELRGLLSFQEEIAPSRYLGIQRWTVGGQRVVDFLWDTTDRLHGVDPASTSLLGVVSFAEEIADVSQQIADQYRVPCALGGS